MNCEHWQGIEDLFDEFSIKPLVAVIPKNGDPSLAFGPNDPDFWNKVRKWQRKGWAIGLHGYTHMMRPTTVRQMFPYYDRSEFSGLSYEEQTEKLRAGLAIFEREGIVAKAFVAPAHCLDRTTVRALRAETPIRIVSDGISIGPYWRHGMFWVPVQIPEYAPKPFGLWTICLHPNTCSKEKLDLLGNAFACNRSAFVALDDIGMAPGGKSISDWGYEAYYWKRQGKLSKLIFNGALRRAAA